MTRRSPVEPVSADDHVRGPESAAVTIIQYGDYDCPHTRASQEVVAQLLADNRDARFVYRHFPLRHLHPSAERLARLAEAATRQGKFWAMHDRMMSHRSSVNPTTAAADAEAVDVDVDALRRDADDPAVVARVEHDVVRGKDSGVHSTPTFFFNGALHDGHYDYDTLAERLEDARRRE